MTGIYPDAERRYIHRATEHSKRPWLPTAASPHGVESVRMRILLLTFLQLSACSAQAPHASDQDISRPRKRAGIAERLAELQDPQRQTAVAQIWKLHGEFVYSSGSQRVKVSELGNLTDVDCLLYFSPDTETRLRRAKNPRSSLTLIGGVGRTYTTDGQPLPDPRIDDSSLCCIQSFPELRRLSLAYTNVGDAGMEHVCQLRNLVELDIDGTDVSDASVACLKGLANLQELFLRDTKFTDAGIVELQNALPELMIHK